MAGLEDLQWGPDGLLPAVVQDVNSKEVLMLAWMNQDALRLTVQKGEVHFWSRSREELWHKGETSGHVMMVSSVHYDCDGDAILVKAWAQGPACHTGEDCCFHNDVTLEDTIEPKRGRKRVLGFEWPEEAGEGEG